LIYILHSTQVRHLLLFMVKDVSPMCPMGYECPQGNPVSRRGTSVRASPPLQLFNQSSLDVDRFFIYDVQRVEYRKIFISTCFCRYAVVVSTANLLIFTWRACQGSRRRRPTEKILISTSISFTVQYQP